jgi:ParB family transcriptional regulator, chromosome partitioning protein
LIETVDVGERVGITEGSTKEVARTGRGGEGGQRRIIVQVSPFRCRMWSLHDRLGDYITEQSCRAEIESFAKHGQLVPALGRSLRDDPDCDVELIFGARRLFVAQHLNVPLLVELREVSDRQGLIAMDIENRHRRDISPYERGMSYARWLRTKYFNSQEEIAHALKISTSQVSRLLKLTQLPAVIVNAFPSPLNIREGWGIELLKAWLDPQLRPLITQRARALVKQTPRPGVLEVYQRLIAPAGAGKKSRRALHDTVVLSDNGTPLFRIRYQRSAVAFLLPKTAVSENCVNQIRQAMCAILQSDVAR